MAKSTARYEDKYLEQLTPIQMNHLDSSARENNILDIDINVNIKQDKQRITLPPSASTTER